MKWLLVYLKKINAVLDVTCLLWSLATLYCQLVLDSASFSYSSSVQIPAKKRAGIWE